MSDPVDPDALAEAVRRCAACGQPAHRYGRNEGLERFDPMACINSLRGRLEEAPTVDWCWTHGAPVHRELGGCGKWGGAGCVNVGRVRLVAEEET